MALTASGIGSNLDINGIVTQLMTIERRPLTLLDTKEAGFQGQLSAYGTLRGALSSFQSAASALGTLSKFEAFTATSSDTTILTATASKQASAGSYSVNVTQLAQRQVVLAAGQVDATTGIGTGVDTTLTFDYGSITGGTLTAGVYTGASFTQDGSTGSGTVTIDSNNNSLQGIRDAINSANVGVTASIVKDGSAAPYRLSLQSSTSGQAHSVRITATGDAALQSLLAYNPAGTQNLTQATAAQDAALTANGLSVTSASNTIADTIEGVSLTLAKVGTTQVSVAQDTAGVKTAVAAFVKAYNDLNKTLTDLTKFDPTTKQAGLLIGDTTVRTIQTQIRNMLTGTLSGLGASGFQSLSQVGVSFQRDGTLTLDSSKLSTALTTNPDSVAALFASVGRPSDSLIGFVNATSATKAGAYDVRVTQLATQGKLVASAAAGLTITAGVNDQLTISVDGTSATVTLAAGTYSASSLATHVQASINGKSALTDAGVSVSTTQSGGVFTITSQRFGSVSAVTAGGTASVGLLGATPTATSGVDVAGTIDGSEGTGSGQALTGMTGTNSAGLELKITGGLTGARGRVDFSRGYAWKLDDLVNSVLSGDGVLKGRTDGISRSIESLGRQRDTLALRMQSIEARYRKQFTALDTLIGSMQSTSNFLTQQLAQLPGATKA